VSQPEYRDKIIQEARELFGRYGFRKTTMDDIAGAIGKAKSSVYYYYDSKEAIFSAVVESEAIALRNRLAQMLRDHKDDPGAQLSEYVSLRLLLMKEMANFYNALKNEYLSHFEMITQVREKYQRKELATLEVILRSGVNKGIFEVKDIHLAALAILTSMQGLEHPLFLAQIDRTEIELRIGQAIDILLHGILKR
jgi:AcrR family transcriptional regulator